MDLVHGPLTGGHSESDPVHARPVAVAVRTACLLLPVRESKSINNVGTSFAINRINERTIDVLARKRQTITNTITRPSGSAVGAGPSPAACGPPARCETGRRRVKRRAGRPLWAYSDQCGLVSRLHASHIRLQYPLITQTHTCRARGLMSVLTDRPRPRRTAMTHVPMYDPPVLHKTTAP